MNFEALNRWLPAANEPVLIAGPCGAESREQVLATAKGLSEKKRISLFRAGVWKPRTRPNVYEGKGEEALEWLKEVKEQFGFKITVEVANAWHAELAMKHNVDVLWVGARTTVNPFSVQEIADSIKGTSIPVMVKNPIHADLQLWIGAIERIYNAGTNKIAAVHRGFHFYGKSKYRNKPLWQLPIELRTLFPDLPIFCDPSHISGNTELIHPVSQKALDLGMDGLMIEVHHDPASALSDAQQQVTPDELSAILARLVVRKQGCEDKQQRDELNDLRKIIDEIDDEILNALKKRVQIIEKIGDYKKQNNITIFQLERWQEILRTRAQWARKLGLSHQHVEKICQLLHEESIRIQNNLMND